MPPPPPSCKRRAAPRERCNSEGAPQCDYTQAGALLLVVSCGVAAFLMPCASQQQAEEAAATRHNVPLAR